MIINQALRDDWKIKKFSDCIIQINTGLNPRKNFSLGTGNLKYITAKNLTQSGIIDFSKCDTIDEDAKKIINKRSNIQIGDILFASRAPIGHCHLIKEEPSYYDIGESIFSIRVNKDIVLPEFLCLYLSSNLFVELASKQTTGSIIKEIRISDLLNTEVVVPPIKEQARIAQVLGKIDQKLISNTNIQKKYEAILKLLYDYWFIQFDFPNEQGKAYKSSGGSMYWCEELNRNIPVGWTYSNIGHVANLYQPKTISEDEYVTDGRYLVFGANGIVGKYDKYNHENNEIAICCRGASCGNYIMTLPYSWITGNAMVVTPKDDRVSKEYIYYGLSSEVLSKYITGSAQPQITRSNLEMMPILVPDKSTLLLFENKAKIIREQIINIYRENQQLKELREYILPMLFNGQIDFN